MGCFPRGPQKTHFKGFCFLITSPRDKTPPPNLKTRVKWGSVVKEICDFRHFSFVECLFFFVSRGQIAVKSPRACVPQRGSAPCLQSGFSSTRLVTLPSTTRLDIADRDPGGFGSPCSAAPPLVFPISGSLSPELAPLIPAPPPGFFFLRGGFCASPPLLASGSPAAAKRTVHALSRREREGKNQPRRRQVWKRKQREKGKKGRQGDEHIAGNFPPSPPVVAAPSAYAL